MTAPRLDPHEKPRLKAQILRLQKFYVQHPGRFFTLQELVRAIGGASEAGVSARLRQLRGEGWSVEKRKRGRALWEYKAVPPGVAAQLEIVL